MKEIVVVHGHDAESKAKIEAELKSRGLAYDVTVQSDQWGRKIEIHLVSAAEKEDVA